MTEFAKAMEETATKLANAGFFGIVIGLIGLAYHNIERRISKCEKVDDESVIQLTKIAADVSHIKEHCSKC